jgi:hypothetical protein
MNSLWLAAALLQSVDAVTIERSARLRLTDTLGEEQEIHTVQRLTFAPQRLRIEDVTFGIVTLVRVDQGKIWTWDRFLKVSFEADLKAWNEAHGRELEQIRRAREAVRGTDEEKRLTRLLVAFGAYDGEPKVSVDSEANERRVRVGAEQVAARLVMDPRGPGHPYEVLAAAGAFHPEVGKALAALEGTPMKGVERTVLLGRSTRVEFEVSAVRTGSVEAALFEPPAGYTRTAGPQLKAPKR